MDSATSEYLFCHDFWAGDQAIFREVFAPAVAAVEENLGQFLANCMDMSGIILMVRAHPPLPRVAFNRALIRSTRRHRFASTTSTRSSCRAAAPRALTPTSTRRARVRLPVISARYSNAWRLAQVNMMLWPRFRVAFDAQLASLRAVSEREVMSADLQAHYITRRYADFAATAHLLAPVNGDGQLDQSLVCCCRCLCSHSALALTQCMQERLRASLCDLLARMAKLITQRKSQFVFLINNFEAILAVLRDTGARSDDSAFVGAERSATAQFFTEQLNAQLHLFVDEELADQFNPLVTFVKRAEAAYKRAEAEGAPRATLPQFGAEDAEPVLRDFGMRWKMSIEEIHRSIVASFGTSQRALDILQRTLSQVRPTACLVVLSLRRLTARRAAAAVLHAPNGARGRACCVLRPRGCSVVQGRGAHWRHLGRSQAHAAA